MNCVVSYGLKAGIFIKVDALIKERGRPRIIADEKEGRNENK